MEEGINLEESREIWLYESPQYTPVLRRNEDPFVRKTRKFIRDNPDHMPRILGLRYSFCRLQLRVELRERSVARYMCARQMLAEHKQVVVIFLLRFKQFKPVEFERINRRFVYIRNLSIG